MLCYFNISDLIIAKTRQIQLQMPCFIGLQKRPLGLCAFKPHGFKPYSHVSEPCFHVFKPHAFKFRAFKLFFGPHSFGPYPISFLYFFNSTRFLFAKYLSCLNHMNCETRFEASQLVDLQIQCQQHKVGLQGYRNWKQIIRTKNLRLEDWKDSDKVLHYQNFPYMLEIIRVKLISRYHDNSFIKMVWNQKDLLIGQKSCWLSL